MNSLPPEKLMTEKCAAMLDALSRAAAAVTRELSLPRTLQTITDIARELINARYAALGVPSADGGFESFTTSGMSHEQLKQMPHEPQALGLLGALLDADEPIRLEDISTDPRSVGFGHGPHPMMKRFLGVPIISRGERLGNLYLTDRDDRAPFTQDDERLITLLANHAAVAIENARLNDQLHTVILSRERDRIGMELHDGVIQAVYAVGMKMEILRGQFPMTPEQEEQYHSMMEDLNRIIEDIRLYIRDLRSARDEQATFKQRLENLVRHFRDFAHVDVVIDMPSELRTLNDRQRHSLTQIVREALSNVARHAEATRVDVKIRESKNRLILTVQDNGKGFEPDTAEHPDSFGLRNMQQRATRLGGTFVIDSEPGEGTLLTVSVPFRP